MGAKPDEQKNQDEKNSGKSDTDAAGKSTASTEGEKKTGVNNDQGFPDDTPVADMTDKEQVAYWKSKARKHESTSKSRSDYDAVVAERDKLKQATMTDNEKALDEARRAGRAEALTEAVNAQVSTHIDARVTDMDTADVLKASVNAAAFIKNGKIDTTALTAYLNAVAPATGTSTSQRDPHQGHKQSTNTRASGRERYAARFKKTTT